MEKKDVETTPVLHVEAAIAPTCTLPVENIKDRVKNYVKCRGLIYHNFVRHEFSDFPDLVECIRSISISDSDCIKNEEKKAVDVTKAKIHYHIYNLNYEEPCNEGFGEGDGNETDNSVANQWILPSADLDGLWESLVYDTNVKPQLLNYISSTLLFSDKDVNHNLISWNRVVLLHGPPGTGKTSLCRALAQKAFIRHCDRYKYGQLIEINSHGLFSKWFSESGKLVVKMFQNLKSIISDSDALVVLLIDEIESLSSARKSAMAGTEPSDAIRVVNAFLTQLDSIIRYPNVLVLTTSNITGAIDLAFVDRADIRQYIGLPSVVAIYNIYLSAIYELIRVGIIAQDDALMNFRSLELAKFANFSATKSSLQLYEVAKESVGLSGRILKKLPLLAHALFLQTSVVPLEEYLSCLSKAVSKQLQDMSELDKTL